MHARTHSHGSTSGCHTRSVTWQGSSSLGRSDDDGHAQCVLRVTLDARGKLCGNQAGCEKGAG